MQGLAGHGKEFGFCSKDNVKSSKGLEQGISVIQVIFFLKITLALMWRMYQGRSRIWKEEIDEKALVKVQERDDTILDWGGGWIGGEPQGGQQEALGCGLKLHQWEAGRTLQVTEAHRDGWSKR